MANKKQTSRAVASTASKILRDNRFSDKSKSVAGSALAQKGKKYAALPAGRDVTASRFFCALLVQKHQMDFQ